MSPEAIRAALGCPDGAKWWEWEPKVLEQLRTVDSIALFRGLFPIAAASQNRGPASTAAWLLYKLKPPCLISCREAIAALLPEWDVSIEEVVFYLAGHFGVATMKATIEELRPAVSDHGQRSSLDTVQYWLNRFQEILDSENQR